MDIRNLQWKAIKWGLVTFIAIWISWSIASNILVGDDGVSNISVFYTVSALSGLLPGYIASIVSGKRFVAHSIATGVVVSLVLLLFLVIYGYIFPRNYC